MSEISRIVDQLQRAYDGQPWYGPSLREVVADVTPEKAAARPASGQHSIWELIAHVIAWERIVLRRLSGEVIKNVPESVNFPPIDKHDATQWQKTLADLAAAHSEFVDAIRKLDDSRLDQNLAGEEYSFYFVLHGIVQHNSYHAGQIAVLKKLAGP
jgi:uncharacterized damage-inducible protein DinB